MHFRLLLALSAALIATVAPAAAQPCAGCVEARYWEVHPLFWQGKDGSTTPEAGDEALKRRADVGIAISGGGTRSAAAAVGQLRGLLRNGWLSRVRYVAAVSGGSWAAVPFTYYNGSDNDLLGPFVPLDPSNIETIPSGLLAARIVESRLGHLGLQEVPQFLPATLKGRDISMLTRALSMVRSAVRRVRSRDLPDPDRRNKTWAHVVGRVFVDGLVPDGMQRPYTWTRDTLIDVSGATGRPASEFVYVTQDRPFLIVGGTLVRAFGEVYPRLIPVEYTSLYTGVRQQFGTIGGAYVSPWAYDRLRVAPLSSDRLLVGPEPNERPFTLADVIASSGAAPQLTFLLGDGVPARLRAPLIRAAEAFPAFTSFAVRGGQPGAATEELPHGDGGFTDNLGIMPLLARGVGNIIAFVNANKPHAANDQLQSFFMPLRVRDGSGDKSMNAVFERPRYKELLDGLDEAIRSGGPAVYCGRNWPVMANELYNVRAYNVNVCWVYNHSAADWEQSLPRVVLQWLKDGRDSKAKNRGRQAKALEHFPHYATFGENKPSVIRLTALQVNLLADLAAWSVTDSRTVDAIVKAFAAEKGPDVLPRPSRADAK